MEPKPKERIVFDEDSYYGDEGEEMAINDLMERDGLTEDEVREDFTDDEIFNHQMEMKDFDYEEEMRALAAFFNGEKSDMSDFVNPYGGNHILVSGSVGRWNGTSTGKWRVHLIYPGERYGLDGCLTYELNAYSGVPAAAHRASYPLVEFYDTSQDAARFPGGQFVSRYYMTDLLEDNSIAVSLDTMLKNGNQFSLDGGIPAWTVEGDDLAKVNDFLKKSCMEFSGSLPGDEKDEDGYSLTGEAKDATASRNGLSRNQMGIEEKAAECKEAATVLANDNAL